MKALRNVFWCLALCGLVCAVVTLSASGSRASILGYQFFSPVDGESYVTSDAMTISFDLYSCNPYIDELRRIYFYIYELYNGAGYYIEISDYNDVADVITQDWEWDQEGYYRARVEETFRVPKSQFTNSHTSFCKAAVTFDYDVANLQALYIQTAGWFSVSFRTKVIIEPIPKQMPSESSLKTALDRNGEHSVAAPYPNPFNPNTTISFSVREHANVSLAIYDVNGKAVKTFYNNVPMSPGDRTESWDGRNDAGIETVSGVYFLRFNAGDYSDVQKMILLR